MPKFDRNGPLKGSFKWNRESRKRDDSQEAEDWNDCCKD